LVRLAVVSKLLILLWPVVALAVRKAAARAAVAVVAF
jgi:hypothetical protein